MRAITRGERIYFGAVGLLALWVGIWGYFIPDKVDKAIPWLVPPLHARFLGAMYLSGTTFMIGGILAHYYAEVKVMIRVILIWTGMLFVSLPLLSGRVRLQPSTGVDLVWGVYYLSSDRLMVDCGRIVLS